MFNVQCPNLREIHFYKQWIFGGLSAGLITPATKTIDHVCKIPEDCHLVRLLVCLVIENHWTDFDVTFHNQQLMIPVTF